jgi:hypothetical protein
MERRQTVKKDGTRSTTPRYEVTAQAGYFKPLEAIKNAKGEVVMYYQRNDKCNPNSTSETRIQCKDSVNFSSVFLMNLKIGETLIGYGEPQKEKMLNPQKKKGKDGKVTLIERTNPFYENRNDGYLFIIAPDTDLNGLEVLKAPPTIEILIVPDGRYLIQGTAKQLADGQFDEALKQMRETAKPVF